MVELVELVDGDVEQHGAGPTWPLWQFVVVVAVQPPATGPQNCGGSQAHPVEQVLDVLVHTLVVSFQVQRQEPVQAGVVVVVVLVLEVLVVLVLVVELVAVAQLTITRTPECGSRIMLT